MSWLFSRALAEEFSGATCLDGEPFAPSKSMPMPQAFLSPDKTTAFSRLSRFGMTSEPLTEQHGADVLTWFLAGFPAKRIAQRLEGEMSRTICGRKCGESWQMSLPGTYSPKTSKDAQSTVRPMTSSRWVTRSDAFRLPRGTWVQTIAGRDVGYLHTPTVKANYAAPSMQKHPCCRLYVAMFGKPSPQSHEYLMGWPLQWTAFESLGMGKFQEWRQRHGGFSEGRCRE